MFVMITLPSHKLAQERSDQEGDPRTALEPNLRLAFMFFFSPLHLFVVTYCDMLIYF